MKRILFAAMALFVVTATAVAADDLSADLINAAMIGDNALVEDLLQKGADVNAVSEGRPALIWAAQNGWIHVVRTLLAAKANVNARDNLGLTALERAVDLGTRPEIVDLLLHAGADVNIPYPGQIYPGRTVLMMAVVGSNRLILDSILKAKPDVNLSDGSGDTALTLAVSEDKPDLIPLLAGAGANLNAARSSFGTPLQYALDNDKVAAAMTLIEAGADVNIAGPAGQTPLMVAIAHHSIAMVTRLLAARANVNARDEQGLSPIYYAIEGDSVEILVALIKAGADVNLALSNGDTPIGFARSHAGNEAFVALLEQAGAEEP
jgi:ankyrin repeat protein